MELDWASASLAWEKVSYLVITHKSWTKQLNSKCHLIQWETDSYFSEFRMTPCGRVLSFYVAELFYVITEYWRITLKIYRYLGWKETCETAVADFFFWNTKRLNTSLFYLSLNIYFSLLQQGALLMSVIIQKYGYNYTYNYNIIYI